MTSSSGSKHYLDFGDDFDIETAWKYHLTNLTITNPPFNYRIIHTSLTFIDAFLNSQLCKIPTHLLDCAAAVLLDLVFLPTLTVNGHIQKHACQLLIKLLKKIAGRFNSTFIVSFDRVFRFFHDFLKSNPVRQLRYSQLNCYYEATFLLRRFFPPQDAQSILDRWFDQIGFGDTKSIEALINLTIFLPYTAFPFVLDSFIRILDDFPFVFVSLRILSYLGRAAHACPLLTEKIDWKPYIDRIFLAILRILNPTIAIGGRISHLVNSDRRSTSYSYRYFGDNAIHTRDATYSLISALIADGEIGELVVKHIERLIAVL
jgi:hypothetical protein